MKQVHTLLVVVLCLLLICTCEEEITTYETTYETADYYVSTSGSDSNPGTFEKPFATINKAVNEVQAGNLVYIRGGEFHPTSIIEILEKHGSNEDSIRIYAYPGEKPIIDGSQIVDGGMGPATKNCLRLRESTYIHVKGLVFTGAKDTDGFLIEGRTRHCTIEDCESYNNGGSGFNCTLGGGDHYPDYITFIKCISHHNYDLAAHGGNADGFAGVGNNRYVDCIAYYNSDDGFDFLNPRYEFDFSNTVIGCVAYKNGTNLWGDAEFNGDGWGFKSGQGSELSGHGGSHIYIRCVAWGNQAWGFNTYGNEAACTFYNCTAYNNGWEHAWATNYYIGLDPREEGVVHVIRNCISFQTGNVDKIGNDVDNTHNTWNLNILNPLFASITPGEGIFLHLDSASLCIDAGLDVGLPYNGDAPDLGAYERK